jgi:hypothetical protein
MKELERELMDLVRGLIGMKCWYVCAGRNVGSTFSLALGERVARSRSLKNPSHPQEYREYEGEGQLMVWCTWRLDRDGEPIASSDQTSEVVAKSLQVLIGRRIVTANVGDSPWDLRVEFDERLRLCVFCDHIPPDPSLKGNWDVTWRGRSVYVGPGTELTTD